MILHAALHGGKGELGPWVETDAEEKEHGRGRFT